MPRGGGNPVPVTEGEASQGFESPDGKHFHFVRRSDVPGLWTVPLAGGPETLTIRELREGYWGLADRGVFFIQPEPANSDGSFDLRFFEFATRHTSTATRLTAPGMTRWPGFAVSRDGRTVFWTQSDTASDDVMLIDPWIP
jgi:hypothetical protein